MGCQEEEVGGEAAEGGERRHRRVLSYNIKFDTCQNMAPEVQITEAEFKRLSNVWTKKGHKFVVNEKTGQITYVREK